jgi:molybdenum cofactor guanylyltransferase
VHFSGSCKDSNLSSVCGIVLAGGRSRRMGGRNKALLNVGGRRIIETIVDKLFRVLDKVIIVTNSFDEFEFLGLPMVRDLIPGCGSLGGLFTGLTLCGRQNGFLTACDMPFIDERVIRFMLQFGDKHDVVIPRIRDYLEPLHAIYSRRCLPHIEQLINTPDYKIINLFKYVDVLEIPERDLLVFDSSLKFGININTPDDLDKARSLIVPINS